jgi:hypothetical protein
MRNGLTKFEKYAYNAPSYFGLSDSSNQTFPKYIGLDLWSYMRWVWNDNIRDRLARRKSNQLKKLLFNLVWDISDMSSGDQNVRDIPKKKSAFLKCRNGYALNFVPLLFPLRLSRRIPATNAIPFHGARSKMPSNYDASCAAHKGTGRARDYLRNVPAAGRVTGTGCFRGCATGSPHKVPSATPAWRRRSRSPPPPPVGRAPACAWWYCRGGAAGSRLQAPSAAQAWRRRHLPSADAVTTTASPSSSHAHRDHKIFTRSTYKKGIHIFYFLH